MYSFEDILKMPPDHINKCIFETGLKKGAGDETTKYGFVQIKMQHIMSFKKVLLLVQIIDISDKILNN